MTFDRIATIVATCGIIFSGCLNAAMWRKIGQLETAVKNICPWGINGCPSYNSAKNKATNGGKT